MRHYVIQSNLICGIGLLVNQLRRNKMLSINHLSNLTGVNYKTICEIERGCRDVKLYTLEKICKGLGISLIKFLQIVENAGTNFIK